MGTPNKGARLAGLETKVFPGIETVVKPLTALAAAAPIPPPLNSPPPEIGVIASKNSRMLTGFLIPEPSDGRVELSSTPLEGMTDYALVPFVHNRMHKRRETAALIDRFLRTGKFTG